jgi:hypothetical protein
MNGTFLCAFCASSRAKKLLSWLLFLATPFAIRLRAEDESPIPHAWSATRYERMKQQSPFALATPVEPSAEPAASFAANWFVSGIGRMDGKDFVTIKARDLSTQFSLYGHDPNSENGVALASIEWSDKIGKSTVVIRKGSETAKLEFNEAEIRGPAQITTAKGFPSRAIKMGTPPAMAGDRRPVTANSPAAPSYPGIPGLPNPGNPGAMTPPPRFPSPTGGNPLQGQDRRRIPIINAPQRQ